MPSGLRKTTGNHFEIYYEQPWGGIADYANPVDIQPNELVSAQGVIAVDGELSAVVLQANQDPNFTFVNPHVANAVVILMWTMNGAMYALDNFGNIYNNHTPGSGFLYDCSASDGPWSGINGFNAVGAVKVINGTAYITIAQRTSVYSFVPTTHVFALGSNYVGGLVMGVLDDYLLLLNCTQASGGPSPSMISWSGPGEFTTWNPSVNQLAGYNQLATVDDQLTGFLSFASVGVAISAKSLIELSPTGVGIGPFSFTALWTSVIGQGCIYPSTITQYGQNGYLTTDSGVYTVSASAGFSDISGAAKEGILGSFQYPSGIAGSGVGAVAGDVLLEFAGTAYPTPYYILAGPIVSGFAGEFYTLWLYDMQGSGWYSAQFSTVTLCNTKNGINTPPDATPVVFNIGPFQPLTSSSATFSSSFPPVTLIYYTSYDPVGGTFTSTVAQVVVSNSAAGIASAYASPLNLVFRAEEIKLERKPTIRRVVVKAYGTGILTLTISGKSFGTITLDGTSTPKSYLTTAGIYTGEDSQLTITSTAFAGSIIKVMLGGTYADGDID